MQWVDDAEYHASKGDPAGIKALRENKTFVKYLSIINNHMEGVRIRNKAVDEQNKTNS